MTTRALFCLFFVGLGCTAKPTTWAVTEDDEYAIYKAIIELDSLSSFGGSTVEPETSPRHVSRLAPLPQLEGFDPVAFAALLAAEAAPKKLDVKRLERTGDDLTRRFSFSRIGFDARPESECCGSPDGFSSLTVS